MSQADNQDPERTNAIDGQLNQEPQGETNFGDSSGPLFTMYAKIAQEEDDKMAESWQKDADGIIIFSGLFSAVVAAVVVVSVQDLKPNSQDISAFYLEKIYQLQADPNASRSSTPTTLPAFSPPTSSVLVNSLWFLSLVISLTCAMLATSLQQWARRYLRLTQPARCSPHKRARMRAFFANGVEKFHVPWAVDALPALVHLSLFLFFAGLLVYLFDINHTVFSAVACWVGLLSAAYGSITLMPIFRHDCPYHVPLSSVAWFLYAGIPYAVLEFFWIAMYRFFARGTRRRVRDLRALYRGWTFGGVEHVATEVALEQSWEIGVHVLEWTADALDEDGALETFFESVPGFYKSVEVKDLQQHLPVHVKTKVFSTVISFLRRTITSNSISGSVKSRRLAIYLNAVDEVGITSIHVMFSNILSGHWREVVLDVELGHFLRSWNKTSNGRFDLYVESIIGLMVSFVRERNDRWIALAVDHLGISERLLRRYLAHGDSLLLANYIHYTRLLIRSDWVPIRTLTFLSEFDIHDTLPELQHEFCALWNELVREAHNDGPYCRPAQALLYIRSVYIVLHRDSDAASTPFFHPTANFDYVLAQVVSSDPFCKDPSHLPEHIPDVVEGPVGESAHLLTTIAQCRDSVPTAATPPSSLPPASHPVDIALQPANEPSLDDPPAPISKSSRSVPRVSPSNPATPLDSSATTSRQANIGCAAISSMATPGLHPPRAATTPISPTTAGLSSGTTIVPPHSADRVLHSPSVAPGTSFSSSPASPPIRSDSLPPVLATSSQSIQAPPNQTLLHPHSATSPLIARPGSSTPDPVSNEAIRGALDDS